MLVFEKVKEVVLRKIVMPDVCRDLSVPGIFDKNMYLQYVQNGVCFSGNTREQVNVHLSAWVDVRKCRNYLQQEGHVWDAYRVLMTAAPNTI